MRFGTSGTVNPSIKAGDFVASRYTAGFDGLMNFYPQHQNSQFQEKFLKILNTIAFARWSTLRNAMPICSSCLEIM